MSKGLAVAGDLHLKAYATRSRDLYGDAYWGWHNFFRRARELELTPVLAGDVFDSPKPDAQTLLVAMSVAGPYYGINGNHDVSRLSGVSPLDILKATGFRPLDTVAPIDINGIRMLGIDAHRSHERELLKERLESLPTGIDVLVLHQMSKATCPHPDAWNLDEDWVPDYIPLVVMADDHRAIDFVNSNGTQFLYTGSLHRCSAGEPDDKSFVIVERDEQTGDLTWRREPVPSRPWVTIKLETEEERDRLLAEAGRLVDSLIQKVEDCDPVKPFPTSLELASITTPVLRVRYLSSLSSREDPLAEKLREAVSGRAFIDPVPFAEEVEQVVGEVDETLSPREILGSLNLDLTEVEVDAFERLIAADTTDAVEAVSLLAAELDLELPKQEVTAK